MARKRRPIPPRPNKGQIRAAAENKAKQNSAPKLSSLRAKKQAARKSYRRELGATKGAAAALTASLDNTIGDLRSSGLRGQFLQSTLAELQSRKGDAAATIPFERASLKADLRDALGSINDQVETERISMESDADAIFKRRLARRRAQRQKVIKNRRQRRKAEQSEDDKDRTGIRNAKLNAEIIWNQMLEDASVDTEGLDPETASQVAKAQQLVTGIRRGDKSAVLNFIDRVGAREGNTPIEARRAVKKFIDTELSLLGRSSSFIRGR